jgi:hypothetical protein
VTIKGELKWLQVLDGDQPGHVALPSGRRAPWSPAQTASRCVSPMAVDDVVAPSVVRPAYLR